jgi:ferritin-like metal-binding protein YciE
MKFFSANLQDLQALYLNHLQKALDMEQQIVKALPTMIEKATDPLLKKAFENHLEETYGHVSKVERILDGYGQDDTITCKVLSALVSEAEDGIKDAADDAVRDVTLIAAAQQVEHHEIAVYGTLRTWAVLLGEEAQAEIIKTILADEKHADILLTGIADRVNSTAEAGVYTSASV